MRMLLLLSTVVLVLSCKTNGMNGKKEISDKDNAKKNLPKDNDKTNKDDKTSGKPVPVVGSDGTITSPDTPIQNPGQKGSKSFTLTVTKLKNDALYKNCLTLELEGQKIPLACNKDFTNLTPKVIELPGSKVCYKLNFSMLTYKPTNQTDCIAKIQANRANHQCDYQSTPFLTSVLGGSPRFKVTSTDATALSTGVNNLNVAFEDRSDGDFNDYIFTVVETGGGHLKYTSEGAELCRQ